MIMARAPFRISFAGGGSDLRAYYQNGYGAVTSAAIDKYMYIMIHPYFHDKIRLKYSRTEDVEEVDAIEHPLIRECLRIAGIERGVEIASIADVPAGTGLGSSSSFTVCLLAALFAFKGQFASKERLAELACEVEIDRVGEPIGKQDQYAASFGGLNFIRFNGDESVWVDAVVCRPETTRQLAERLAMFFVGDSRPSRDILLEQSRRVQEAAAMRKQVGRLVSLAEGTREALHNNDVMAVGELLHEGWQLKRELAEGVTNPRIDSLYEKARKAGAIGGKLVGAGGTGFLLFFCPPERQEAVRGALELRELKFGFDQEGAKVIHYSAA